MGREWRQGEEAQVRRASYLPDKSCTRTRGQARCPPGRKLRKEQNRKQSVKTNNSDSLLCKEVAASGAGERVAAKHRIGASEQRQEKHPPAPETTELRSEQLRSGAGADLNGVKNRGSQPSGQKGMNSFRGSVYQ